MSRLKKSWIVVANVALMAAILVFVALYSNHEKNENYEHQVEHFVNKTVAMERVTENYLEGEQAICNNWAHYINSSDMTLEEAAAYVRATHAQTTVSGHLIDAETMQGYSSRPRPNTEDDYSVSYQRIELLGDGSWIRRGTGKPGRSGRHTCCGSSRPPTWPKSGSSPRRNMRTKSSP